MKTVILATLLVMSVPAAVSAQSLMDASRAAIKARVDSTLVWIEPRTTEATVAEPVTVTPSVTPVAVTPTATLGEASPAGPTDALAKNRAAAMALLGTRLVAARGMLTTRDRTAAEYREACAGKETSAGWLLRGELITTPNEGTPACRTMASELATQATTYTRERAAMAETARTSGILPGVWRDLLTSHALPD